MKKEKEPKAIPIILRILQKGTYMTGDLFDAFTSGYGESYRKLKSLNRKNIKKKKDWDDLYIKSQRFYNALYYLKINGFIKKESVGNRKYSKWNLTKKGKEKTVIQQRREKEKNAEKENVFKIIIFDIPEDKRRKRAMIRESLERMEFSMLQKSVWIGKNRIPEDFLFDLKEWEVFDYVHIFTVEREGTIAVG